MPPFGHTLLDSGAAFVVGDRRRFEQDIVQRRAVSDVFHDTLLAKTFLYLVVSI